MSWPAINPTEATRKSRAAFRATRNRKCARCTNPLSQAVALTFAGIVMLLTLAKPSESFTLKGRKAIPLGEIGYGTKFRLNRTSTTPFWRDRQTEDWPGYVAVVDDMGEGYMFPDDLGAVILKERQPRR